LVGAETPSTCIAMVCGGERGLGGSKKGAGSAEGSGERGKERSQREIREKEDVRACLIPPYTAAELGESSRASSSPLNGGKSS
jgi:hypothetical protein